MSILDTQFTKGNLFGKDLTADQIQSLYGLAGTTIGAIGDTVNTLSNDQYKNNAGRDDLAYLTYGNSWGDVFNNSSKLESGLDTIRSLQKDYSDAQNTTSLTNAWNSNDFQDTIRDSSEVGGVIGSVLTDAGKFGAAGTTFGPLGTAIGAGVGLISGLTRGLISADQHDKNVERANAEILRANRAQLDSFYDTNDAIKYRQARQDRMNYFDEGGSLEELNGVTKIDNGNTHEQNPYNGVQMGIASDGLPNLVEEGEIVYKDYVYSNRLKPSKSLLKQYNLPEKYVGKTFAEIGDKLQKESEERPNDPISKTTLDEWMLRLQNAQEEYKAKAKERRLAKVVDNMSNEEKAALLSSLEQPMAQQEGIDLSQPMYAKGGKIYIKPSHRGRLTELKKRTGKSEAELWKTGSSATRKMITFARNARKWHKHDGESDTQYLNIGFPWPTYQTTGAPLVDYSLTPRQEVILAAANPATTFGELTQLRDNLEANNLKAQQNLDLALLNDKIQRANLGVTVGDWQLKPSKSFNAPLLEEDKSQPLGVKVTNKTKPNNNDNNSFIFNGSMLRYAPAVGAGLGALVAALQPIDYTLPNRLEKLASEYKPIGAPHIGGYRRYTSYDINLGDAENIGLTAQALAANRGQNRATQGALNAAVLAKAQETSAKRNLAWQQANEANRLATDQYNLGIDQFNAQRDSQYDQLNQQILNNRINILGQAAQAADASRTAWANNISGTTENFFNQLGNVGRDEWNRNQFLQWLIAHPAAARQLGIELQ